MDAQSRQAMHMDTLARLAIRAHCGSDRPTSIADLEELRQDLRYVELLSTDQLAEFRELADINHVIVRALTALKGAASIENQRRIADWCACTLAVEQDRIENALDMLHCICTAMERNGCPVVVIKSLDHCPDLGSDLDLYTLADARHVEDVMCEEFLASPVERSWGDRLAQKWNYRLPHLAELVEVHIQVLGQTGEHSQLARRVIERRTRKAVNGHNFYVAAPEERIVISALQRVYRHFYFRLCDMLENAVLIQSGSVNLDDLRRAASSAGIWPGVATFLCLIRNYIQAHGGALPLPDAILAAAHARDSSVRYGSGFLRVSKVLAAGLYGSQLLQAGLRGDVRALLRLPLLPPLAVSALVAHKLTGNDKGVW
jgi:hypothetical protein